MSLHAYLNFMHSTGVLIYALEQKFLVTLPYGFKDIGCLNLTFFEGLSIVYQFRLTYGGVLVMTTYSSGLSIAILQTLDLPLVSLGSAQPLTQLPHLLLLFPHLHLQVFVSCLRFFASIENAAWHCCPRHAQLSTGGKAKQRTELFLSSRNYLTVRSAQRQSSVAVQTQNNTGITRSRHVSSRRALFVAPVHS